MPDTSCSLVVAMVNPVDPVEAKPHPDGHEPSEGNIAQVEVSELNWYPTHDDHWLHSC